MPLTVLASASTPYITASSGFALVALVIKTQHQAQRTKIQATEGLLAEASAIFKSLVSCSNAGIPYGLF